MKRIFLFLLTNLAVLARAVGRARSLLGLDRALYAQTGIDVGALLVVLGGRRLHRRDHLAADVEADGQVVDRRARDRAARATRPKRGCVDDGASGSPTRPASACPKSRSTRASRTRSRPARSATRRWSRCRPGLLQSMNSEEVEAVLGHEIAHVANGDMVTLTLIQGVVNTFVVFLARVVGVDRRPDGVPHRARHRSRLLHHRDRRADRARHPGVHHRRVVLAPARVPRRRRQRAVSWARRSR